MASTHALYTSLLRPPILHILRAAGFHAARPSVVDALVSLSRHYLLLLASASASHARNNHFSASPTVTDVRMALTDCGVFHPSMTLVEEEWRDKLRRPITDYREQLGVRVKEQMRRDAEDTKDVAEFLDWIRGDVHKEIRRIAGLLIDAGREGDGGTAGPEEDYLTVLKKRYSKTGEESRYQGTVLGKAAEDRVVKIEGPGPFDDLRELKGKVGERGVKRKRVEESDDENMTAEGFVAAIDRGDTVVPVE